ncbi:MAG: response regulator [Asticcacaulis sp.]|nr:response regulator [Asticcacaulis sp.]
MSETATILVIEDETEIRKFLRVTLSANGFTPVEAETAREGLQKVIAQRPDLILLDLGLPDQDGQDFLRELREWSQTPVVVVSAREQEAEKIAALEGGADDYLTKPFSAGELLARIRVALRHARRLNDRGTSVYTFRNLSVDLAARRVILDGEDVHLTPIEYKLLATLVKHAGKVLTHAQLLKEVWGRHSTEQILYLRIHAQHLREKLKDDPLEPRFILTEPGVGYRFRD